MGVTSWQCSTDFSNVFTQLSSGNNLILGDKIILPAISQVVYPRHPNLFSLVTRRTSLQISKLHWRFWFGPAFQHTKHDAQLLGFCVLASKRKKKICKKLKYKMCVNKKKS